MCIPKLEAVQVVILPRAEILRLNADTVTAGGACVVLEIFSTPGTRITGVAVFVTNLVDLHVNGIRIVVSKENIITYRRY